MEGLDAKLQSDMLLKNPVPESVCAAYLNSVRQCIGNAVNFSCMSSQLLVPNVVAFVGRRIRSLTGRIDHARLLRVAEPVSNLCWMQMEKAKDFMPVRYGRWVAMSASLKAAKPTVYKGNRLYEHLSLSRSRHLLLG